MTIQERFKDAVHKAPGGSVFFLSGGGGTGKTHTLNETVKDLSNVITFAFTGDAALLARGKTGNSTFGIPTDKRWNPKIRTAYAINKARDTDRATKGFRGYFDKETQTFKKSARQRVIESAHYLVLDEASMEPGDHMDAIDVIMRDAKKKPHVPFGGCVVILVGDRGQIPPVMDEEDTETMLSYGYAAPFDALTAQVFKEIQIQKFQLTKIWRQKNQVDGNVLNRVRIGRHQPQDLKRINHNVTQNPPKGATVLCCENVDAVRINNKALKLLNTEPFEFKTKLTGTLLRKHKKKEEKKGRKIDTSVHLKMGCRVIIASNGKCNHDGELLEYVNGDQGTFHGVTAKRGKQPGKLIVFVPRLNAYVYLKSKKLEDISRDVIQDGLTKTNDEGEELVSDLIVEKVIGTYQQFPIRLGYAMSGHKSQGKTLERVHLFLGNSYRSKVLKTCGYIYVLLSRVTDLNNLSVDREIEDEDIMTSPELIKEEAQQQYELL